jgi:hypothetical protein
MKRAQIINGRRYNSVFKKNRFGGLTDSRGDGSVKRMILKSEEISGFRGYCTAF